MSTLSNRDKDLYRYFLYSKSQEIIRTDADNRMGKKFILGQVLVKGRWVPFTQISAKADNEMWPDCVLIAEGYLKNMTYKEPRSEWK